MRAYPPPYASIPETGTPSEGGRINVHTPVFLVPIITNSLQLNKESLNVVKNFHNINIWKDDKGHLHIVSNKQGEMWK